MKTFKCGLCSKEFVSELTLQQHYLSKHDIDYEDPKSFADIRSTSTSGSTTCKPSDKSVRRAETIRLKVHSISESSELHVVNGPRIVMIEDAAQPSRSNTWASQMFNLHSSSEKISVASRHTESNLRHGSLPQRRNEITAKNGRHMLPGANRPYGKEFLSESDLDFSKGSINSTASTSQSYSDQNVQQLRIQQGCLFCTSTFPSQSDLDHHTRVVHGKTNPFNSEVKSNNSNQPRNSEKIRALLQCAVCSKRFNVEKELRSHVERDHREKLPCYCFLCSKVFGSSKALTQHSEVKHSSISNPSPLAPLVLSAARESASIVCVNDEKVVQSDEVRKERDEYSLLPNSRHVCPPIKMAFLSPVDLDRHQQKRNSEHVQPKSIPEKNELAFLVSVAGTDIDAAPAQVKATRLQRPVVSSGSMIRSNRFSVLNSSSPTGSTSDDELELLRSGPQTTVTDASIQSLSEMLTTKLNSLLSLSKPRAVVPISQLDDYSFDNLSQDTNDDEDDDSSLLSVHECPSCSKVFQSAVDLDRHQSIKHYQEEEKKVSQSRIVHGRRANVTWK